MANCDIHDLKYNERFYTWRNKQVGDRSVMSTIDRVLSKDKCVTNSISQP